ncbi:XdhC family protein [Cellulomonas sp. URHD0024]|uniref:XdhC family protein n=1 Tax=Cellulomonas sp. URHD0024 TaxID=1302620 RepID=UPI000400C7C9|nr:XdhC/CoxI family protein [Cellulomonas sp. URHD0024]
MLEIADRLLARLTDGHRVAVATVISMSGSGPTVVGTSMAVDDTGAVIGSVAGGCVEGALYELCASVLAGTEPGIQEYGVTDDDAFAVGLTCGGVLRVHARELGPADLPALSAAAHGAAARVVVPLSGVLPTGRELPDRTGIVRFTGPDGGVEVFVEVSDAPSRMVIYGALEFSAALSSAARAVGYRVTVCDARAVLATPRRHPGADEVVVDWPVRHLATLSLGPRDVVAVMSHDERFDADLVLAALRSGAGFVGAMGSRRTQDRRTVALLERGATADELALLHAPIGLDIGASTPAETAVSVLAEVLAARAHASGRPLTRTVGPIHRPAPAWPTTTPT